MPDLTDPADLGFDGDRLERIGAFLEKAYVGSGRLPNTQILVARDGKPVYRHRAGVQNEAGDPLREDALFRIASMTKPVTSIAFMQLVEQCKVALDDPISRVLPEFASPGVYSGGGGSIPFAPTTPARPIRFVDLLTHTAGLTYGLQNRTNVDAAYREANLDLPRNLSSDDYVARLAKLPLQHAPGERWTYSVATDVLGVAVERLSGQKLGDYFRDHIFGPLGMDDTGFDLPDGSRARLSDNWAWSPNGKPSLIERGTHSAHFTPAGFHSGGGGLASSIEDYHRFCTMLLQRGALDGRRIIAPKTLALMTANHLPGGADLTAVSDALFSEASNAGTGFGLGFACVIDPVATLMPASRGEYYWGGAFSTAFFVDPVERVTMVFMTQLYPSNIYPLRRQLKTMIYAALSESHA
ncbi:serine hydrolase domain-containing protein [Aurantiacibacter spongiae]|uniref:Class A beta-lactamase-related serine hydrolase n=1 Tax=Aurantiacibacter spongiae TaxID=2488860 RepID=A0A3N5CP64_9SPHN|nr:serine hydrolase domain-containing protein [Aurantiacibacter spongiae]RPF70773.1 class A beta-lactamase-related serine hydrolase [Aurantiacibacter spongiae]